MKVIKPKPIELIYSTITEDEYVRWDDSITYAQSEKVIYEHYIYMSMIDDNVGNKPGVVDILSGTPKWIKIKPTNTWAMFDTIVNTQTSTVVDNQDLIVEVGFGRCTGLALLNIVATDVFVEVFEGTEDTPYWEDKFELLRDVDGYAQYFREPLSYQKDLTITGIPVTKTSRVRVTIKRPPSGGHVAIGNMVVGPVLEVGATLYDVSVSMTSYSRSIVDEYGNTILIKRSNAKKYTAPIYLNPRFADKVYELLVSLDSVAAVYIGDNRDFKKGGHQCLTAYGFVRDFSSAFSGPNVNTVQLDIQGLI